MRATQVSKMEFKAKVVEYFRQVETLGGSIVITDNGKPTLEVLPFRGAGRKPLDILAGSVLRYEDPTRQVDVEW